MRAFAATLAAVGARAVQRAIALLTGDVCPARADAQTLVEKLQVCAILTECRRRSSSRGVEISGSSACTPASSIVSPADVASFEQQRFRNRHTHTARQPSSTRGRGVPQVCTSDDVNAHRPGAWRATCTASHHELSLARFARSVRPHRRTRTAATGLTGAQRTTTIVARR